MNIFPALRLPLLAGLLALSPLALHAAAPAISPVSSERCDSMKAARVLNEGAPVACARLRLLRFSYLDFDGKVHDDGEIMVLDAVAEPVRDIFATLFKRKFPIARAQLLDHYLGDDEKSMADNNTSGFNHRPVAGGGAVSLHAYGVAIDLNPVQNPYIRFDDQGQAVFHPASSSRYANRLAARPSKPYRPGMAEEVVEIFASHGFLGWGGDWDTPIDYQHFQVNRKVAERLASLPPSEARTFFAAYIARYRNCRAAPPDRKEAARARCVVAND